jgi:hypothetical protein
LPPVALIETSQLDPAAFVENASVRGMTSAHALLFVAISWTTDLTP